MSVLDSLTLDITQTIKIESTPNGTFSALLRRLSTENSSAGNKPMPMVLEEWPGGRWFRDLGTGEGHLWGFVQVIKPPTLIEINGPMFMSYAVAGHLQFRLTPTAGSTELTLRHQVLGAIHDDHRSGLNDGWGYMLHQIKAAAEASS